MDISRIEMLRKKIDDLYRARHTDRAEWADWLFANHIFVVADYAKELAERFGANGELAMAAGMLHDVADATMKREDPRHAEESICLARALLHDAGFNVEEIAIIVDDAIKNHGCRDGQLPQTLEGKVMAAADALAHLKTDFYEYALEVLRETETLEQIKQWALPKIERDFGAKIFDNTIREEARADYERAKALFETL